MFTLDHLAEVGQANMQVRFFQCLSGKALTMIFTQGSLVVPYVALQTSQPLVFKRHSKLVRSVHELPSMNIITTLKVLASISASLLRVVNSNQFLMHRGWQ